jgi:hypothetical protein
MKDRIALLAGIVLVVAIGLLGFTPIGLEPLYARVAIPWIFFLLGLFVYALGEWRIYRDLRSYLSNDPSARRTYLFWAAVSLLVLPLPAVCIVILGRVYGPAWTRDLTLASIAAISVLGLLLGWIRSRLIRKIKRRGTTHTQE